ncbi:MAG: hypothetical protein FWD70_01770 [Desulfuromonadales bacterium]|nr:hypothetical protein [Desulfuromonadales bacterium]
MNRISITAAIAAGMFLAGCTISGITGGQNPVSNVATGPTLAASAGTHTYTGGIALSAAAINMFAKIGKPKVKKISPELTDHILSSPWLTTAKGKYVWKPKQGKNKVLITEATASPVSMGYTIAFGEGSARFIAGDFGDGGEEAVKKNLDAWEHGGLVVAEYHGSQGGQTIYIISNKNKAGYAMTDTEWVEKKAEYLGK